MMKGGLYSLFSVSEKHARLPWPHSARWYDLWPDARHLSSL